MKKFAMGSDNFLAVYLFEVSQNPEMVFDALAREQTTAGYDTLSNVPSRLDAFRASVSDIEYKKISPHLYSGKVTISFPGINLSTDGNPVEDILCFCAGETHHVNGIEDLQLTDLSFPENILNRLPGPRYGIEGIRKRLNVYKRPLLLGPLRPEVGFSAEEYAQATYEALMGGADIIKDDELLVNPGYSPLERRIKLCAEAARKAEDDTGKKKMYIPNIGSDISVLASRLDLALKHGADGIMVHPKLTPSLISRIYDSAEIPIISHYSTLSTFARRPGARIRFALMLSLYRLCGADFLTFPRPNLRFQIDYADFKECLESSLSGELRCRASFPAPTGGNTISSVMEVCSIINSLDYVFVSGSEMFEHPDGIRIGAGNLIKALCSAGS